MAIKVLDTKENECLLPEAGEVGGKITSDVLSETERAIAVEKALDRKVDEISEELDTTIQIEEAVREADDLRTNKRIDAEIRRAINAENALRDMIGQDIDDTVTALSQRISDVDTTIQSERARAIESETALNTAIEREQERALEVEEMLESSIQEEAQRASTSENMILTALQAEREERVQGDTDLRNKINRAEEILDTNVVTVDNTQTITGQKTFQRPLTAPKLTTAKNGKSVLIDPELDNITVSTAGDTKEFRFPSRTGTLALQADLSDLTVVMNSKHAKQDAAISNAQITADEAKSIAQERPRSKVFDTVEELTEWISIPENVQDLPVGTTFLIRATDVPDYWWDGHAAIELETRKLDLDDYYTKNQTDAQIDILDTKITALESIVSPITDDVASLRNSVSENTAKNVAQDERLTDIEEGKLDKAGAGHTDRLYGVYADGAQTLIEFQAGTPRNGTIAMRTQTGQVKVTSPTATDDATPKAYVDNAILNLQGSLDSSVSALTQAVEGAQETADDALSVAAERYMKPEGGIPENDLDTALQEKINNKSDKYFTTGTVDVLPSSIVLGDDLSGAKLKFNTSDKSIVHSTYIQSEKYSIGVLTSGPTSAWEHDFCLYHPEKLDRITIFAEYSGSEGDDANYQWLMPEFTLPDDFGLVTDILNLDRLDKKFVIGREGEVAIDVEHNYKNKADKYFALQENVSGVNLATGMNLSGATLTFDVSKTSDNWHPNPTQQYIRSSGGYTIWYDGGPIAFALTKSLGTGMDLWDNPVATFATSPFGNPWSMESYTLPNDFGIITEITAATGDSIGQLISDVTMPEKVVVDCEYNYNQIQSLKKNSGRVVSIEVIQGEGGGTLGGSSGSSGSSKLYMHCIALIGEDANYSAGVYLNLYTHDNTAYKSFSEIRDFLPQQAPCIGTYTYYPEGSAVMRANRIFGMSYLGTGTNVDFLYLRDGSFYDGMFQVVSIDDTVKEMP